MEFSAKQIAAYLNGTIEGDENATVSTFAKIEEGVSGALSFLSNPKYTPYIYQTASSIVLVNHDFAPTEPVRTTLIRVPNAYEALARLMTLVEQSKPKQVGISEKADIAPTATVAADAYVAPFAVIGEGAVIGSGAAIMAHTVVGSGCKVGDGTTLHPHVTLYPDCKVGKNCIIHAGAVIGADGFGFAPTPDGYEKIPQIGIVVIEDNVEIGANTCVDRSTMGATIVHKGVKLDNLVQIAHNVEVGSHTVMASQVGIAGSTKVGEWCMFGGQVGVAGHITIGDRCNVGAQSGIPNSVKPGNNIMGSPAIEGRLWARCAAAYKKLPDIYAQMGKLTHEVQELKPKE